VVFLLHFRHELALLALGAIQLIDWCLAAQYERSRKRFVPAKMQKRGPDEMQGGGWIVKGL